MKKLKSLCLAALLVLTTVTAQASEDWEGKKTKIKKELADAIEASDLDLFAAILDREQEHMGGWLLIEAYEKAMSSCDEQTLSALEALLNEKEISWYSSEHVTYLESIVEEIENPVTLKRVLATGKISQESLDDALDHQFQSTQVDERESRLELAKILIDQGADWRRGFWLAISYDTEGLEFLQTLPQFDISYFHHAYLASHYDLIFKEIYPIEEILCEPASAGFHEENFIVKYCKTHRAVPTKAETVKIIEEDFQKPFDERWGWWALMLPAIDDHEIELSTQVRTHLAMDFLSYYPFLGFFNSILYPYCVPIFLNKLASQNLDPRIIAERVFSDSLTDPIKMAIDEEDPSWQYRILVERAYAFYQLIQDPIVRDLLMQLPYDEERKMDGKTFVSILSDLGERVDLDLGAFPWFKDDEECDIQADFICEIGKLYFQ